MPFIRFVLAELHEDSNVNEGLFRAAYSLRNDGSMLEPDRCDLSELLGWFEKNLHVPARFNRTRSKGHYRRAPRGVCWFRDSAVDCISRMHAMKRMFETYGHQVTLIRTTRPGYVVYEDAFQIVAEPFSDTNTGA